MSTKNIATNYFMLKFMHEECLRLEDLEASFLVSVFETISVSDPQSTCRVHYNANPDPGGKNYNNNDLLTSFKKSNKYYGKVKRKTNDNKSCIFVIINFALSALYRYLLDPFLLCVTGIRGTCGSGSLTVNSEGNRS